MMNDNLYNTFDETHIPLSATATMWMDRINTTNPTRTNLLNSQSVVQIILRRAPAPDHPDLKNWNSKRLVPLNQHLVPTPSIDSKHLFGNFLSPTQAARSREWKKTHAKTYLRPSVAVNNRRKQNCRKHMHLSSNLRPSVAVKNRRTQNYRKHMHLSSKSNFNTCHSQHDATQQKQQQQQQQAPPKNTRFPPMHQRHINRQQHAQSTSALEPITSGTFYKSRRAIFETLQDNEQLSKLTTRKIRMETKLQETLKAWTHMHGAIGDAVKVLHESQSTEKESKRVYPRLLQSMERNRKQLQRQLEKMTRLVDTAHQEEQDFIELIASKMRGGGGGYKNDGGARKHKRMKAKTTRTLL